MQNKNVGNENKIMLGDLNCTMDKTDRDGENKTQRLYRCCANYVLPKLIVDNGIEDLWIPPSTSATIGFLPKISVDRM